ncbi:MAG: hypothetical protein ACF8SC_03500 [Phycisphaerales bacterium JB037]
MTRTDDEAESRHGADVTSSKSAASEARARSGSADEPSVDLAKSGTESPDSGSDKEPISPEVLEKLPPEAREVVQSWQASMQTSIVAGPPDPIGRVLTADHFDKILDNEERRDSRRHAAEKFRMGFVVLLAVIGLIFVILITWMLAGKSDDLLEKIIVAVIAFVGGLGAGLGGQKVLGSAG